MVRRGKVVLTTGAFDILHPGHIYVLKYARRFAGNNGRLVVVVARDSTVKRNKGSDTLLNEKARLEILRSIRYVDEAILGYRPLSFEKVMRRVKPDVVVFGYDQTKVMREFLSVARDRGWKVRVVRAPRLKGFPYSTSMLLSRAARLCARRNLR